jgi:hypothetical protein
MCLSDLRIDKLHAGELAADDEQNARAHLDSCARCAARVSAIVQSAERYLAKYPAFQVPPKKTKPKRPGARVFAFSSAAAGVLAVAAGLFLYVKSVPNEDALDTVRSKGTSSISYFVKRGERIFRGEPGEPLYAGDTLRFTYKADRAKYLGIVSLDAQRHATIYYPATKDAERIEAGTDTPLASSVELDDTLGTEHVSAFFCDKAIALEPLRLALENGTNTAPPGCTHYLLVFEKRRHE